MIADTLYSIMKKATILLIIVIVAVVAGILFWKPTDKIVSITPAGEETPSPRRMQNGTPVQAADLARRLAVCESISNGSTQDVHETTRLFINLPEDIYPYENRHFTGNGATADTVSNGEGVGPQKSSMEEFVANKCATHYYEFSGTGTVDLTVKSALAGIPDYTIHFRVQ
jgi:hypothetical protein